MILEEEIKKIGFRKWKSLKINNILTSLWSIIMLRDDKIDSY